MCSKGTSITGSATMGWGGGGYTVWRTEYWHLSHLTPLTELFNLSRSGLYSHSDFLFFFLYALILIFHKLGQCCILPKRRTKKQAGWWQSQYSEVPRAPALVHSGMFSSEVFSNQWSWSNPNTTDFGCLPYLTHLGLGHTRQFALREEIKRREKKNIL